MATPVEVIGLVLGALPLVISALEHYREGLDPIKDYLRYNSTLKSLQIRLRIEQDLYQGTLKRLLLSELSQSQVELLFPDPEEPLRTALWGTDDIKEKLQFKLGKQYDIFMDMIQEMETTIKKLMDKLDIDVQGKPKWTNTSSSDANQNYRLSRNRLGWEWRRIRRSFGKREREELIQSFERYNSKLAAWVQNDEILAPPSERRAKSFMTYFDLVRDHACHLYNILEQGWSCSCVNPHDAILQLDQRNVARESPLFQVCFSFYPRHGDGQRDQRLWQETQIRVEKTKEEESPGITTSTLGHAMSTTSNGDLHQTLPIPSAHLPSKQKRLKAVRFRSQLEDPPLTTRGVHAAQTDANANQYAESHARIACLCKAIHDVRSSPGCLGLLPDPSHKQSASITTTATLPVRSSTPLRLDSLLSSKQRNTSCPFGLGKLSRQQRLGIAVTLASTVLQLYKSPWFDEIWSKNDVYFLFNGLDEYRRPSISNPYVLRSFASPTAKRTPKQPINATANQSLSCHIINKTLFALGIMLIELCFNRPFEDLRSDEDLQQLGGRPSIVDDYQTAISVVDDVFEEGGDRYGSVVQRCLKCEFPVQDRKKKLELDTFRGLFYEGVLVPLEEDYNKYSLWRDAKA